MIRINLLPGVNRKHVFGRQQLLIFLMLLIAEGGVLYYLGQDKASEVDVLRQTNRRLKAKVSKLEANTSDIDQLEIREATLKEQQTVLAQLTEGQTGPVKMLNELSLMLTPLEDSVQKVAMKERGWNADWDPRRLWIDAFVEEARGVTITGHARSNDDLAEFLKRLNTSRHFIDVHLNVSEMVEVKELGEAKLVRFDIDAISLYGPTDELRYVEGTLGMEDKKK